MPFWIAAAGLVAAVAALFILALRKGSGETAPEEAQGDVTIYRDQLAEVERDLARGTLDPEEAHRLRTEISRRILDADRAQTGRSGAQDNRAVIAGSVLVLAVLASTFWLYDRLGAPAYPDMPLATRVESADAFRAARPSQAQMEQAAPAMALDELDPEYSELLTRLRAAVAERPDDLQGQLLLVRNEAALGNFAAAARAQAEVVRLKAAQADAADHSALADLMILAAGGGVSPEAEAALTAALSRDPADQTARFYSGLLLAQTGRPDLAFRLWRDLLEESDPASPWVPTLRQELPQLAWLAGVEYTLPADGTTGPNADDIAAAADMTDEAREEMVRGMVDRLSARLAREGGTAEDWARLIGSLKVLGEDQRARQLLAEAETVFYDRPQDLDRIRAAAIRAGVVQ